MILYRHRQKIHLLCDWPPKSALQPCHDPHAQLQSALKVTDLMRGQMKTVHFGAP